MTNWKAAYRAQDVGGGMSYLIATGCGMAAFVGGFVAGIFWIVWYTNSHEL